ncbi:cytochrome P450 Cyp138 [Mycobacterium tuberculosis]|nr:cytochrome P450 Cyp138 [Mycobacterium tuberculosis]
MSEVVTAAPAPPVVRLPPAVRGPKLFQGLAFVVSRRRLLGGSCVATARPSPPIS